MLFLTHSVSSQIELTDVVRSSKWTMYAKLGTGISNEKRPQYYNPAKNYEGWYVPGASASIGVGIARSVGNHLRLSSGVNYDYYSIKSDPFYQIHIGPGTYEGPNGPLPVITYDDELSVAKRNRGYVSIPVILEYYGKKSWAPYFKLGVVPSFRVYDNPKIVYKGTRQESYGASTWVGATTFSGLFGTFGGGVQYKKDRRTFTFGLSGNVGIVPFSSSTYISEITLPNSLHLEVGVHQQIGGKRRK